MKCRIVLVSLILFCAGCDYDLECDEGDVSCDANWIRLCHLDDDGIFSKSSYWVDNTNCAEFGGFCKEGIGGYHYDVWGDFESYSGKAACVVDHSGCADGMRSVCASGYIYECSDEQPYAVLTDDSLFWKNYGGKDYCVEVQELKCSVYAHMEGTCIDGAMICADDSRYGDRGYYICSQYTWSTDARCETGTTCSQFSQQSVECVR